MGGLLYKIGQIISREDVQPSELFRLLFTGQECADCAFREKTYSNNCSGYCSQKIIFLLTYPVRAFMISINEKTKFNIGMKLMTKRSTCVRRFTESCRWWDYSIQ